MVQVKAALCSALYPNIAVMEDGPDGNKRPAWNDGYSEVAVHPSSINHMLSANQYQRPYQIYLEKVSPYLLPSLAHQSALHVRDEFRHPGKASLSSCTSTIAWGKNHEPHPHVHMAF